MHPSPAIAENPSMLENATRAEFRKIVRVGTVLIGGRPASLFVEVTWADERLSFCGVEGPLASGDALGSCGQIGGNVDYIDTYAPGWSGELARKFRSTWKRWHLNDMRAGNFSQEEYLRANPPTAPWDYIVVCGILAAAGLHPDPLTGYAYGQSWCTEVVPTEVLEFIRSLPDADQAPAWV